MFPGFRLAQKPKDINTTSIPSIGHIYNTGTYTYNKILSSRYAAVLATPANHPATALDTPFVQDFSYNHVRLIKQNIDWKVRPEGNFFDSKYSTLLPFSNIGML